MHHLAKQAAALTEDVIGAAIEVHRDKGPGLLESIYEWCLVIELGLLINFNNERLVDGVSRLVLPGAEVPD
jgi:PD-(D/E)XK nuclease superfamily protein